MIKGTHHSAETIKKLIISHKGQKSWNKGKHLSNELRRKLSEAHKGYIWSKESKRKLSESIKGHKGYWKGRHISNATKTKMSEAHIGRIVSKATRKKLSKINKGRHHTKKTIRKISEAKKGQPSPRKGVHLSEATKRKISKAEKGRPSPMKGKHLSKEAIRKNSAAHKGQIPWNIGKRQTKLVKMKVSKSVKKLWKNPNYREHMIKVHILGGKLLGEKSHLWQGGISFEPYDSAFNRLFKELIREKFKHKCFICGKLAQHVHHINYVKKESIEKNVVLLCMNCHAKTNTNRDYWFAFFCYHLGIEPYELA